MRNLLDRNIAWRRRRPSAETKCDSQRHLRTDALLSSSLQSDCKIELFLSKANPASLMKKGSYTYFYYTYFL